MRRESVARTQHVIEVVGVPVVADEGEDGDPHVGLEGVPLEERQGSLRRRGVEQRLQQEGQRQSHAQRHVVVLSEALVGLRHHHTAKQGDPSGRVEQGVLLELPLAGLVTARQPSETLRLIWARLLDGHQPRNHEDHWDKNQGHSDLNGEGRHGILWVRSQLPVMKVGDDCGKRW
eukprot:scaffold2079_cov173-Ochromonas_danica.AAC.4